MMAMFLQHQLPRNIPLPETPAQQQGPSLRFATSTPRTGRTVGLDTTIRGIEDSLMDTPVPTPESSQFKQKEEIKLPDERKGIMLDTRKVNLHFDGSEVEVFIKRVEKVASMHGAGGQDVALQLPFMIKDRKISEAIENMEGHETRDWELLKKELIRKWGRATPLRRYDENSIPNLISKYTEKGGIQTKEDYRTFISDLEEILAYLKKMGYENVNADSGNPLWNAISTEMRRDVAKELAHNKKLRQTKDGKGLIPKLDELKDYVEASLSIMALGVSTMGVSTKSATKLAEAKKEVETKSAGSESTGKLTQLQEEIDKLRTELNTSQNTRAFPPHLALPRQPTAGFRPMGGVPYQRPQIQCFYCKEGAHTVMFCPHLTADLDNKLLFKQGPNYYYPNRQPIPADTSESIRDLVRKYSEKTRTEEEEKKANTMEWQPREAPPMQMPITSMISTNRWEMWSPPEMHYGEDDEDNHIGFGLRRSQRLGDKGKEKEKADQSVPEKSTGNSPTAPPPNQEANKQPAVEKKRRPSYPGAWVEGDSDDGSSEASGNQEPVKTSEMESEKKIDSKSVRDSDGQVVDKSKVGGGLRKKFLKQSFTLTLEELLLIAPKFIQELQNFSKEEVRVMERSQNSGRCNRSEFEEGGRTKHEGHPSPGRNLTYACPLGFVNLTINGRKLRALVDSGAELNIMPEEVAVRLEIPTREISMSITGIGGHSSPVVGSKFLHSSRKGCGWSYHNLEERY
ncbi:hypothetical protein VP01_169g8 [Puccinia sorghi]|uniref:Peptidase A2 domain-containing protein n=1 Tax=Puccinia sorghi TaxID=27349 RepID=A0A0L6VFS6_9BASI|nr:hypothetical protein VP01_169g8 [Puccinia sorghi]